jgi:type VI secretion system secreted protein Hcp
MAVHMFVKIDDINGESIDSDHKDWIDVVSWTWGMTQSGNAHLGSGTGTGKVSVRDVSFTKYVDSATPILIKYCCKGKYFSKAQLVVCKAGNKTLPYLTLTMTEGLISSFTNGGAGQDERLVESVSLNFKAFKLDYVPQKAGSGGGSIPAAWDIAKNSES